MAFPQTPLDVRTDLQIGGAWTDVSADTYLRDPITITRGRNDEASRPDHSRATITFNNRLGKYSPRNKVGPYYGLIGRNTPVRISVPATSRYLRLPGDSGARASTPDAAALDIVGDIDVRADLTLLSWATGSDYFDVLGKWSGVGGYSYRLAINPIGAPYLAWSPDGATVFAGASPSSPLPVPPSGRIAVRATLDVDNGAGGWTASFYWSASGTSGPWTLLGTVTDTGGTTSIFSSAAALEIGDVTGTVVALPPVGKIHAVEVRNGIAGSVVASPVFSTPAAGATSFADSAGRTWTMAGSAEISDREYRFHGEVSSWPPKWDVSGKDRYVPVEAAGVLRRYGAGTSVLQSTLRRRIPSDPNLIAYWPMEEDREATRAYSPLSGVTPMTVSGLSFAADDTLDGSQALPSVSGGATIRAAVPRSTTGAWRVEFVYNIATAPAGDANQTMLVCTTSAGATWRVGVGATLLHLNVTAADGSSLLSSTIFPDFLFGTWGRFKLLATQSGGNVAYTVGWTAIGGAGVGVSGTYAGTVGAVTTVATTFGAGLDGMKIGHLAVFDTDDVKIFDTADTGFAGEQAHIRIDRLCKEQGMPMVFLPGTGETAEMGPQRPATILDLLEECAVADLGILHETRQVSRLAFRRRTSLYNQAPALALDYLVRGNVAPPLEPVDDDQAARNDITVSRTGGSSAHAVQDTGPLSVQLPPNGIGPVNGGGTYNLAQDEQLPDMAGWLLHLGAWDDARYPSVHVDLAGGPSLIPAALLADVGDRITIAHPPPEAGGSGDTLDLIAQGYTETLGEYDWDITFNCTPGGPWRVGVLDDTVLGRADTDGSQLAAGITSTATSFQVQVTTGPLWITTAANPAEFPVDVVVAGEVMTVGAISGTSSPQTFSSVTRSVNGVTKAQLAGADVRLATPMILAL